jgi:hypothetical protein
MLQHVHMGFGPVDAQELHIKIEQGLAANERVIDNRGKPFDGSELGRRNLPGGENRFPGDDELERRTGASLRAAYPSINTIPGNKKGAL